MSIDAGAQVAIIILACGPRVVIVNLLGQVCTLGRPPRTKETLPDFHEWFRATRHPRILRRLTGCQRTPGFWGVSTIHGVQYILYFFINNFHAFTNVDPLSVTICTTFAFPTSLITSFNKSYMYLLSLILSNTSTDLRKIVLLFNIP